MWAPLARLLFPSGPTIFAANVFVLLSLIILGVRMTIPSALLGECAVCGAVRFSSKGRRH